MTTGNRDFIDFLIELFKKKNIFIAILVVFIAYAVYFNRFNNTQYSYETDFKIASESLLIPIINNINVYNTRENAFLNPLQETASYGSMVLDICDLLKATFADTNFYYSLVDDFLVNNPSYPSSREEITLGFKGAIKREDSDPSLCIKVKLKGEIAEISYLNRFYPTMLNMYIEREINNRLNAFKDGKLEFLENSLNSTNTLSLEPGRELILGNLELNELEERRLVALSKKDLIYNTEVADTNINFLLSSSSTISKTLNSSFVYSFSIFLAIIVFVLTVVLIDFKSQYQNREKQDN